jgi:limonene 1,2-monooxygenase
MHFGLFMMPLHPPHRAFVDAYQRDVDQLVLADELGFCEAWVGEHLTERWENAPAPTKHVKREPAPAHGAGGAPGRAPGLAGRRERDPWN